MFGRGDTLLHGTHLRGQRRLVAYRGRQSSQQSRYFGTGLCETENVVDKEKNIFRTLSSCIPERFRNGQSRQCHRGTGSGRFVHLPEDQGRLGLGQFVRIHFGQVPFARLHTFFEGFTIADHTGFDHLSQQIIPFTGSFANTGKDRKAVVLFGNVVDQFHDQDGFADTCTTEQSDFPSFAVGLQ